MPNVALIPRAGTSIAELTAVVDGFPETAHKLETTTGGEPLEDGRNVTDHAIAREEQLTLTGWVSDFNGGERPAEAWENIRRLHREVTTLEVVTEWGTYPEMIISRCNADPHGRGMRFRLELHQIIRVGVIDLDLPPEAIMNPAADMEADMLNSQATGDVAQSEKAAGSVDQAADSFDTPPPEAMDAVMASRETADKASAYMKNAEGGIPMIQTGETLASAMEFSDASQEVAPHLSGLPPPPTLTAKERVLEAQLQSLNTTNHAARSVSEAEAITRSTAAFNRSGTFKRGRVALGEPREYSSLG